MKQQENTWEKYCEPFHRLREKLWDNERKGVWTHYCIVFDRETELPVSDNICLECGEKKL